MFSKKMETTDGRVVTENPLPTRRKKAARQNAPERSPHVLTSKHIRHHLVYALYRNRLRLQKISPANCSSLTTAHGTGVSRRDTKSSLPIFLELNRSFAISLPAGMQTETSGVGRLMLPSRPMGAY